jgi:SAM-dependent methyltransferase
MVQEGWVHHIVATDLSAKALASAQALATELPNIHYVQADMNALPVGEEGAFAIGSFDAVIGISSVHHCTKLEDLYANLVRLLKPSGWLFLDEYVGPDRFQWSSTQLKLLNRVADLLPARLMTTLTGDWRRNFRAPTVEEVVAVDPSEAVRSSELIPIMLRYFDPIEVRPYGGGILHMLLANTAQNLSSEQARVHRQCVIAAEEELYSMGRLSHDFACVIARAPNAAASESSNPCH